MFGKQKATELGTKDEEQEESGFEITTIPEAFYGGKDPEIYHAKKPAATPSDKKEEPKKIQQQNPMPSTGAQPQKKSRRIILVIIGLLVLLGLSISITWFFFIRPSQVPVEPPPSPQPTVPTPPPAEIPTTPEPTSPPELPTSTPTSTDETPIENIVFDFPRIRLVDAADLDSDGLTDLEEEYYGTDSGTWDTDGDGFQDGLEIINLYSPTEEAPTLLTDSGSVTEYVNPTYGYRVYYPIEWEVASVDTDADQVLFTAITGDYVEIIRSEKTARETFTQWFARSAKDQRITDLLSFENRFDVQGSYRQDRLVAYFDTTDAVYVMIYHPGTEDAIPFRQTMIMMYQSFRPTRTQAQIPVQPILPPEDDSAEEPLTTL